MPFYCVTGMEDRNFLGTLGPSQTRAENRDEQHRGNGRYVATPLMARTSCGPRSR
jgi:hypothetical protein